MNIIKRWWLYLSTQTEPFTEALKNVKEGDIITFEKWRPCFIWDNQLKIQNVGYKRFSGYVRSTNGSGDRLLEFTDDGEANIFGVEILKIKSGNKSISKYPSNFAYFALRLVIGIIGTILVLALIILLMNILKI